ncbi:MAG TPA: hypothetical protein PJ986_12510 [Gammaproteobacteria bacterium]|nr:hypothetical protein [Gammaproteobacteria bacterium]
MAVVRVDVDLDGAEAWGLAQFIKRVGWSELRANAEDDEQAYAMRDALNRLREALEQAGYAPR